MWGTGLFKSYPRSCSSDLWTRSGCKSEPVVPLLMQLPLRVSQCCSYLLDFLSAMGIWSRLRNLRVSLNCCEDECVSSDPDFLHSMPCHLPWCSLASHTSHVMEAEDFCSFAVTWIELNSWQLSMSLETHFNFVRPVTEMDALIVLRANIISYFRGKYKRCMVVLGVQWCPFRRP